MDLIFKPALTADLDMDVYIKPVLSGVHASLIAAEKRVSIPSSPTAASAAGAVATAVAAGAAALTAAEMTDIRMLIAIITPKL